MDEVGLDAQLRQQAFVKRGFGVNARQHQLAGFGHDDFIAGAGHEVVGRLGRIELGVNFLARGAEATDCAAELFDFTPTDFRTLNIKHEAGDGFVFRGLFETLDGLAQVELGVAERTRLGSSFRVSIF